MEQKIYEETLIKAFADNGLGELINEEKAKKLHRFSDILIETNKSFNLTAITDEKEIILKHFIDCATVLEHIPRDSSLIDVGCGAGFPSLPIAILREDVTVTALDSTSKKITFISSIAQNLSLGNITAVVARAEDYVKEHRGTFDASISRAVARMNVLAELCLPLTKTGGLFIAMKSSRGSEEYAEAKCGIKLLGGEMQRKEQIKISSFGEVIERELYIIHKCAETPAQYPRNFSQIIKKPL